MTITFNDLGDAAAEVASVRMELEEARSLYENAKTQTVSEVQALTNQVMARLDAVEARLTSRETAHNAIINQQTDLIQQLTSKLQGVLEVKPEIMPYDHELAKGYVDIATGIKLRADSNAQRKLTGQLLLVKTAVELGAMPVDAPVTVWDYLGQTHQILYPAYLGLMLRYGAHIMSVESRF